MGVLLLDCVLFQSVELSNSLVIHLCQQLVQEGRQEHSYCMTPTHLVAMKVKSTRVYLTSFASVLQSIYDFAGWSDI